MCFLLTVTLMTYCIRKASSGSCMMEICILSFLVILPILAVLTALYLLLPFFSENEEGGEQKRSATHKCEKSRIVGLLQRIYPDSDQLKFKCNMLNFGDNLGVVLTGKIGNFSFFPKIIFIPDSSRDLIIRIIH